MSELVGIITAHSPEIRNRSLDALLPRGQRRAICWPRRRAGPFSPRERQSVRTRARAVFSLRDPSLSSPFQAGRAGRQASAARRRSSRFSSADSMKPSILLLAAQAAAGPSARHVQRAGRRLSRPGLSDPGGAGAPQRSRGPRQSVDVAHRASRRLPARASVPNSAPRRRRRVSRSCANPRPSAWI